MPKSTKSQNRHVVDRLFDLRAQIKALTDEADRCKDAIMASGDYVGDEHIAVPKSQSRKSLDRAMLEDKFGKDAVASCLKESSFVTLNIFAKADVAALTK